MFNDAQASSDAPPELYQRGYRDGVIERTSICWSLRPHIYTAPSRVTTRGFEHGHQQGSLSAIPFRCDQSDVTGLCENIRKMDLMY